jgi:mevalonate kinase
LHLLVGDTGLKSSTKVVVGDVRRQWQEDRPYFEELFDGCGAICEAARAAIEAGEYETVGRLMNENHALLVRMTVSCDELDSLVETAVRAGASGAKLSGAGRGGNMIALVTPASEDAVHAALLEAGARHVFRSVIGREAVK